MFKKLLRKYIEIKNVKNQLWKIYYIGPKPLRSKQTVARSARKPMSTWKCFNRTKISSSLVWFIWCHMTASLDSILNLTNYLLKPVLNLVSLVLDNLLDLTCGLLRLTHWSICSFSCCCCSWCLSRCLVVWVAAENWGIVNLCINKTNRNHLSLFHWFKWWLIIKSSGVYRPKGTDSKIKRWNKFQKWIRWIFFNQLFDILDIACFVSNFVNSLFNQVFNHFTTKCSKSLNWNE